MQEGHQVFALVMGADRDARNQDATRALRVELPTVRPMVEEGGASNWDALKVLKARQTSV